MKKKYYKISFVSKTLNIEKKILLSYEEAGLISPMIENRERLYSDKDLERIEMIRRLTQDLDVNLAGVEVILNMRDQIINMQNEFDSIVKDMKRIFMREINQYETRIKRPLIAPGTDKVIKVEIKD